jgi:glutamate synthase (NADPH) large chain
MKPKQQGLYSPEFEHDNCGAGFICNLNGKRTNEIIHKALDILVRLEHRGAVSADGRTGDGAGILIEIPHSYFKKVCDFEIPESKEYAVGMVFLPPSSNQRKIVQEVFEKQILRQGLKVIGWREVPVDHSCLGSIAALTEPNVQQIFIGKEDRYFS